MEMNAENVLLREENLQLRELSTSLEKQADLLEAKMKKIRHDTLDHERLKQLDREQKVEI